MKKLFLAALLSTSMIAVSQEKEPKGEQLTLEQKTELKVKKMTLDLDLSEKQQQELKTLFLEEGKKTESKKSEMKAKKEKGEKPTAEEKFEMKSKMLDKQIEMKGKLKKILTPEQMSKLEKTKEDRPQGMYKRAKKIEHKK